VNNIKYEELLHKSTQSVEKMESQVKNTRFRQRYHFMSPAYWLNDPNGLIQFNGFYHLFYQHNPYSAQWGEMHWGHAISKDLVHWKYLPIALAPSEKYDSYEKGGCFSGSAVNDNGVLTLLYTGTSGNAEDYSQQQCLAYSTDGINFTKYEGNPVISAPPADGARDFRDPKVWKHENVWYMVVGSCKDNRGKALLYRSPDLKKWEYIGVMAESRGDLGTMWECPDLFEIDGKYVLTFSPMDAPERKPDRKSTYLTGNMDYKTGKLFWNTLGETDWGFDFYASQSFTDDKERRILIGWANGWDWMPWFKGFGPTAGDGWCGAMSLPRTVHACPDGKLCFAPIEELKTLREEQHCVSGVVVDSNACLKLEAGDGISYEIEAEIDLSQTNASEIGFLLRCSKEEQTKISCDLKNAELGFDRTHSDPYSSGIRKCLLESASGDKFKLHIFVDTCSVEIFTDDGRTVMSCNIYPSQESTGLFFYASNGCAKVDRIKTWGLTSIW
jgi:beta-fructofuranosidase